MDEQITDLRRVGTPRSKAKIGADEIARRREHVRVAQAESRIEGQQHAPESDAVFEAYVRGDIEVTDIVPQLKALYGVR